MRKRFPIPGFEKRQEIKVAIFDRFVSKGTGEQERKPFPSTPYRKMFSELDAAGKEAKAKCPDDSRTVDDFVRLLKELCRARHKKALDDGQQAVNAQARFFLSEDRMSAYACLLPPENGGNEIILEEFLDDIHYEGISYGILQDEIQQEFDLGYLHVFPVARGKLPQAGEDGKVTELFQRRKHMRLEVENGEQVSFDRNLQLQPIRKGTIICLIRKPKAGTDGMDVTGQALPCAEAASAWIPQGENTAVGRGGQTLVAGADGILYIENDQFCIHAQKIIDGDLDQFQGTLRVSGNLYIGGNVDAGADIEASGDIVIGGRVGQARITSTGGTIRVEQGIYGAKGKTFLTAACQVQTPVVERAKIDAGTSVITEAVLNGEIRCGGTVYAMSGRGIIVDSVIWARDSVLCLRVGNLAGGRSQFSVGYPPQISESWKRVREELPHVQSTLEKLWEPITSLRKKGSRISEGEEALLQQLAEQRDLYMERREALAAELRRVDKVLDKKSRGKIRCEKLCPVLEVQIGRLTEEITTQEEACDIHMEETRILLR